MHNANVVDVVNYSGLQVQTLLFRSMHQEFYINYNNNEHSSSPISNKRFTLESSEARKTNPALEKGKLIDQ